MAKKLQDSPIFVSSNEEISELRKVFSREQKVLYKCLDCGLTMESNLRIISLPRRCPHCTKKYSGTVAKRKATLENKYGSVDAAYSKIFEKIKATNLERYGAESPLGSDIVWEGIRKTNLGKYGVEYLLQSDDIRAKGVQTIETVYGVSSISQADAIKEKIRQTCIAKYGVPNPFNIPGNQDKAHSAMFKKFGDKGVLGHKEYLAKVQNAIAEKYGEGDFKKGLDYIRKLGIEESIKKYGAFGFKRKDLQERAIEALKKKYNVDNPHELYVLYTYNSLNFDSSWELYFYIYCIDSGKEVYRKPVPITYTYKGTTHKYYPDFSVDGQLYEIKGDQFFNPDGTMCNPFDHSQDGLFEAKHQCALANNVIFLKQSDMKPYIDYVNEKYTADFVKLFNTRLPFPYLNPDLDDKSDMGLIHHFHKSIYEASRKGKPSPLEAWNDKELVKKVALNRLKYMGHCKPSDILQGFNVTRIANKVSVFKPSLAERLIDTYLSEFNQIFDPFSGFSGRMIAACNKGKSYIGQDINEKHVIESNQIKDYKNYQNCTVTVQNILTDVSKDVECLFTCPPYGGKEHWNERNDEIEKTCDEWIDICLSKYHAKKYVFVVDTTEKYKENVVETLTNKSHFGKNNEYVIVIENW